MSLENRPVTRNRPAFQFREFCAEARERRLTRNGEDVAITPKSFDALLLLLQNAGRLVERATLREKLWDGAIIEETALARVIADVRKALGDVGAERRYIATVSKFGYRFIAPVERIEVADTGLGESISEPAIPTAATLPAEDTSHGRRSSALHLPWILATAAVLLIAGGIAAWIGPARREDAGKTYEKGLVARQIWASLVEGKPTSVLSSVNPIHGTTIDRVYGPAVSRDGHMIAFTHGSTVWVHDLITGQERWLVGERDAPGERCNNAIISPDGKLVAYEHASKPGETAELCVIGADGSNPRRLARDYRNVSPSAWSPDGKQILAAVRDQAKPNTALVSVADGSLKLIDWHESPRFSPDLRYIAFVKHGVSTGTGSDIYVQSVDRGTDLPLVRNFGAAATPVWAPDGKRVLFVSDHNGTNDLWSITVADGKPVGPPELIKENTRRLLDATRGGDYYYQSATLARDLYLAGIDPRTGKLTSKPYRITSRDANGGVAWSPDGELLAYYRGTTAIGKVAIVIRSMKTGEERELSAKGPLSLASWQPQWFPDSRSLLVHSWNGTLRRLHIRTGEYQPLLDSMAIAPYGDNAATKRYYPSVILAPDGRTIYYLARDRDTQQTRVLLRDLGGGPEKELYRLNADVVRDLSVSPDGGRLAFLRSFHKNVGVGNKRDTWGIMIVPSSGGEPKEVYKGSETLPWRSTVWSKDGRRLFFVMGAPRCELLTIRAEGGEPQPLGIGLHDLYFVNLHPDGKQIVFADEQWNNQLWVLKNLLGEHMAMR